MFDTEFRDADDAALVAAIAEWQATESAAAARRLAAIAELTRRRCAQDEQPDWACDGWDGAAAEISAALGIGAGRASGQMNLSLALAVRLPRVAALFWAGRLSLRVISAIAWRTDLVTDDDALAEIDAALTEKSARFDSLSQYKLEQAIDVWVDRHDPGAVRLTRSNARSRDVSVGGQNHESGTAALWGRLYATDATLLESRLAAMAAAVCADDPRTMGERRADALGALAAGDQNLACRCGDPRCPAAMPDGRSASVTVHILAEQSAVESAAVQSASQEAPGTGASGTGASGTAVLLGGGVVPTPLLAELLKNGARIRQLRRPSAEPELRYRPSAALDEFVRMRDLTCRFPGCDQPAEVCDIDHATPWPLGLTHPSNLRCLCRKHHLLRTFRCGEGGWRGRQDPDGTIVWTAPSGHSYTTVPGSRLLFPHWDSTIADLPAPTSPGASSPGRGLNMPRRRRSRVRERASRIRRERLLNAAHVAERTRPPPF